MVDIASIVGQASSSGGGSSMGKNQPNTTVMGGQQPGIVHDARGGNKPSVPSQRSKIHIQAASGNGRSRSRHLAHRRSQLGRKSRGM